MKIQSTKIKEIQSLINFSTHKWGRPQEHLDILNHYLLKQVDFCSD